METLAKPRQALLQGRLHLSQRTELLIRARVKSTSTFRVRRRQIYQVAVQDRPPHLHLRLLLDVPLLRRAK